jgi:hypothetical protein
MYMTEMQTVTTVDEPQTGVTRSEFKAWVEKREEGGMKPVIYPERQAIGDFLDRDGRDSETIALIRELLTLDKGFGIETGMRKIRPRIVAITQRIEAEAS